MSLMMSKATPPWLASEQEPNIACDRVVALLASGGRVRRLSALACSIVLFLAVSPLAAWAWSAIFLINEIMELALPRLFAAGRLPKSLRLQIYLGHWFFHGAVRAVAFCLLWFAGGINNMALAATLPVVLFGNVGFYFTAWPLAAIAVMAPMIATEFVVAIMSVLSGSSWLKSLLLSAGPIVPAYFVVRAGLASATTKYNREYHVAERTRDLNVALEEAKAARQEAEQQRVQAEAANAVKSQFMNTMSHELRTPLNAIIGYSEILREGAEDDARHADVEDHNRVLQAAQDLLQMVNAVLDISRAEHKRLDLQPAVVHPVQIVRDAIAAVCPQAEANGTTIALELVDEPPQMFTDGVKLGQCLRNLLCNASKFTVNGVITVRIRVLGENIVFDVIDNGPGIPADKLRAIFDPFVQVDGSITRKHDGSGLGLAITKRLAEMLGGEISMKSVVGEGSTFSLCVPITYSELENEDLFEPAQKVFG